MNRRHFLFNAAATTCASGWLASGFAAVPTASGHSHADNLKRLTEWVVGAMDRDGSIRALAKKPTEIGPLTLLAYSDGIWR